MFVARGDGWRADITPAIAGVGDRTQHEIAVWADNPDTGGKIASRIVFELQTRTVWVDSAGRVYRETSAKHQRIMGVWRYGF